MSRAMSHERFERWILADAPLNADEQGDLRRHLTECGRCAALHARWSRLEARLSPAVMRGPRPGFVARWAARQEIETVQRRRRAAWRLFGWTSVGATAMAASLSLVLLQAPAYLPAAFARALQQALRLWLWTRAVGEVTSAFASNLPAPVEAAAVIGVVGLIGAAGLLAGLGTFGIIRFSFQGVRK